MKLEERWIFVDWYQGCARYRRVKGFVDKHPTNPYFHIEGDQDLEFLHVKDTFDSIGKAHGAQKSRTLAEIKKLETEIKKLNKVYERLLAHEPVDITKTESK